MKEKKLSSINIFQLCLAGLLLVLAVVLTILAFPDLNLEFFMWLAAYIVCAIITLLPLLLKNIKQKLNKKHLRIAISAIKNVFIIIVLFFTGLSLVMYDYYYSSFGLDYILYIATAFILPGMFVLLLIGEITDINKK